MDTGTVLPRAHQATAWRGIWRALVVVGVAAACVVQFTRPSYALFVGTFIGVEAVAATRCLGYRARRRRPTGACRAG